MLSISAGIVSRSPSRICSGVPPASAFHTASISERNAFSKWWFAAGKPPSQRLVGHYPTSFYLGKHITEQSRPTPPRFFSPVASDLGARAPAYSRATSDSGKPREHRRKLRERVSRCHRRNERRVRELYRSCASRGNSASPSRAIKSSLANLKLLAHTIRRRAQANQILSAAYIASADGGLSCTIPKDEIGKSVSAINWAAYARY